MYDFNPSCIYHLLRLCSVHLIFAYFRSNQIRSDQIRSEKISSDQISSDYVYI